MTQHALTVILPGILPVLISAFLVHLTAFRFNPLPAQSDT